MAEQGLKDKTVKGVGWSAIDNVSQYAVSFIVSIILARLLSPDDYGLLGIVAIFTAICTNLINGGFSNALIRKNNVTDDDYNTVFITNMGMSLLLYCIIFLCAPVIAHFFNRIELIALTRVSSLGMIIGAFAIVQQTRLTKRIDFKTQTKISLISSITSGIVGIVMALLGCGVWSLVAQGLVSQGMRTILLWVYNHWLPKLFFSKRSFSSLFGFGWKLMVSGLLDTIWKELYQVVVGKFYSPATLGQYTRAKGFAQMFSTNITSVIQRVTYPVLSEIQNEEERLVGAYRRMIKVTMLVTAITIFALGAVAEPLIYCLIGPKWNEAAEYLPFICVSMSLFPLHAINLNMLQVQGRSDIYLVLEIVKKVIGIAPLAICYFYGIKWMLIVNIFTSIISFFLNSYYTGKRLGYSSWMQLKDVFPSYAIATTMALSVYFIKYIPISYFIILPIQLIVGFIVVCFLCEKTQLEEYREVKGIASSYFSKIKRQ